LALAKPKEYKKAEVMMIWAEIRDMFSMSTSHLVGHNNRDAYEYRIFKFDVAEATARTPSEACA